MTGGFTKLVWLGDLLSLAGSCDWQAINSSHINISLGLNTSLLTSVQRNEGTATT